MSVRANASFVRDIAREHGSFGKFLANWPSSDEAGLLELLAKRGSRLGGNTGQMMLRFLGWDGFVTSRDVVLCLRDAGLDIAETVTSKRDLAKVQAQFNAWAEESGLPYVQISRICAMSIGENYAAEKLESMMGARLMGIAAFALRATARQVVRNHMTKNPCVASRRSCSTRPYSQSR